MNDKQSRGLVIFLSLMEALAIAALFGVVAFQVFVRYQRMANADVSRYEYQGTASFDYAITEHNGKEYPAGTVFKVDGFNEWGTMTLMTEDGERVYASPAFYNAKNSEELTKAFEAARDEAIRGLYLQDIRVIVFAAIVCFFSYMTFANMNGKLEGRPGAKVFAFCAIIVISLALAWLVYSFFLKMRGA